jgi:hypothetical protein
MAFMDELERSRSDWNHHLITLNMIVGGEDLTNPTILSSQKEL